MRETITPRERVNLALNHKTPDRTPVDFLAVKEIWEKLLPSLKIDKTGLKSSDYYDCEWEEILRKFHVDCRVLSYDQFFAPPDPFFNQGDSVSWWDSLSRSTPNRMFRRVTKDGGLFDLWGHQLRVVKNPTGAYEEVVGLPLTDASASDVNAYSWPDPDWWNFDPIHEVIEQLDEHDEYHIRFRAGSIFEVAWQLVGMDKFLMNLAIDPTVPLLIMDHLTEIYVELAERVLKNDSQRIDMLYFYDDVATQNSLMISKAMWKKFIKPRHMKLVEVARKYDKKVLYHCDGSIYPLIPDLIEMGIDVLNPIQVDAKNMDAERLKTEFGEKLCFHGGIDNIHTLPFGTPADVQEEVRERTRVLGENGGYVIASTHHIQSNTPVENVLAMYDASLRENKE